MTRAGAVLWLLAAVAPHVVSFAPLWGEASALGARAVEGVDRVRLLPPAGARIEDYRNAGYLLRWIGDEIEVEVDTGPLDSQTRFEPARRPASGPIERLAAGLTAGAGTHYEAVSRILGWVARHVEYDLDRGQPQSAQAVLDRRSGYCTGVARLTVALLEAVGIEAREVAGYVVGSVPGRPSGYHRWIEAYLPDRGWVFSDPLVTHHYVPATYLRLAAEDLEVERGTEGLLLERLDAIATVDLYPLAPPGVTARRSSARQLAAALRIRLEDQSNGTAVLEGRSSRWTHALIDGKTTFVGLDPGSYQLRLLLPGRGIFESPVELPNRVRKAVLVTAPALRLDRIHDGASGSPENSPLRGSPRIKRDR